MYEKLDQAPLKIIKCFCNPALQIPYLRIQLERSVPKYCYNLICLTLTILSTGLGSPIILEDLSIACKYITELNHTKLEPLNSVPKRRMNVFCTNKPSHPHPYVG